jgi:hypothetical protein
MRDYQRVATIIYHDETLEPGAPRHLAFFDTIEELDAYWRLQQSFNPNYLADLYANRWYGWNRAAIITTMNDAFFSFSNYPLFITGYDGVSLGGGTESMRIFVESPRRQGFNSLTEKPHRRK